GLHVLLVIGFVDQGHAGGRAPLDLMQHAVPRAVREHRGAARAQLKHLLQQRNALAYRAGARKRSEIAMLAIERTAMEAQLRGRVARQANVRIALVVAIEDVVARLERLDQVVLEQQRLAFGAYRRRGEARDLADAPRDPRLVTALLEVARDALLEIARLADVEC